MLFVVAVQSDPTEFKVAPIYGIPVGTAILDGTAVRSLIKILSRYFMDDKSLTEHKKTKNHKKRIRLLKDKPYTQAEAEMAAGMGSFTVHVTRNGKPLNLTKPTEKAKKETSMDTFSPASTITSTSNVMEGLNIG